MNKLTPGEISGSITLITNFMCDESRNLKTFGELVEIFEKCYKATSTQNDHSKDLRILDYEKAMNQGKWKEPIILIKDSRHNTIVDGIHRGVAYLRCIKKNIQNQLPDVYLIINHIDFQSSP